MQCPIAQNYCSGRVLERRCSGWKSMKLEDIYRRGRKTRVKEKRRSRFSLTSICSRGRHEKAPEPYVALSEPEILPMTLHDTQFNFWLPKFKLVKPKPLPSFFWPILSFSPEFPLFPPSQILTIFMKLCYRITRDAPLPAFSRTKSFQVLSLRISFVEPDSSFMYRFVSSPLLWVSFF